MYEYQEKNLIKILNAKKETKEVVFENFINEIKSINSSFNGEEDKQFNVNGSQLKYIREVDKYLNMNLMNYILRSKNELIYDYVMKNYKEKIEFKNANSYYAFLIELLNQKKVEDFFHYVQLEEQFSQENVYYLQINKQLTKRDSCCFSSSVGHIHNNLIRQALLLDIPDVYNHLISSGMYSDKQAGQETYKIKKWFLNRDILESTPSFILKNMEYFKNQKDSEVYEITCKLVDKYNSHYQSPLQHFIIKNSAKTSIIVKDFKTIIDLEYSNNTIESYFKNNILHHMGDSSFTDKEYETIGAILKKYSENNSRPEHIIDIFADFFFRHNYDIAPSVDYTKHVPYRFEGNQKLYEIITQSMMLEEKQEIPRFFLNGIFDHKTHYTHPTDKRDLPDNISTIEAIYKSHALTLSKPEHLLRVNSTLLENSKLDINLYKYADKEIYPELHKQSKQKETTVFKYGYRANEFTDYLSESCFYSANTKSMENSILKSDKDYMSILRELALIKIYTKNDYFYSEKSQRIDSKIDTLLKKTNIIPKEEFNNFIVSMQSIIDNSTPAELEINFSTLFEKMHLKNALKSIEPDDSLSKKRRI